MKESECQVIITIPEKYPHTNRNVSGRSLYNKQKLPARPTSYIPKAPPFELKNIKTLLKFAKSYQRDKFIIDHYKLRKIKKPLEKLNNIV